MVEFKERKIWLANLRTAAILLVIGLAALLVGMLVMNPKYSELKTSISETSIVARKITSTLDEADQYAVALDESGKEFANLATNKDFYIQFVGEKAQENQLNINKMTVDDIVSNGSLYTMKVEIELQGDLYSVKNFVQGMYDSKTVNRINSFSYRLQSEDGEEFQWMWRSIDDTQLVPWLDISDDSTSGYTTGGNGEDVTLLDADAMMRHGRALCFLEVEFVGTGG